MTIQPPYPSFLTCFHFGYNPFEDDSLYAFSLLFPYLRVATHVCFVRYTPMFHLLDTCVPFVSSWWDISLTMVRHKFHHGERQTSPWWEINVTMVKITKHTSEKDAKHRRKQSKAGEKRKGIVLRKAGERGWKNNEKGLWAEGNEVVAGNETARYQRVTGCLYI